MLGIKANITNVAEIKKITRKVIKKQILMKSQTDEISLGAM